MVVKATLRSMGFYLLQFESLKADMLRRAHTNGTDDKEVANSKSCTFMLNRIATRYRNVHVVTMLSKYISEAKENLEKKGLSSADIQSITEYIRRRVGTWDETPFETQLRITHLSLHSLHLNLLNPPSIRDKFNAPYGGEHLKHGIGSQLNVDSTHKRRCGLEIGALYTYYPAEKR